MPNFDCRYLLSVGDVVHWIRKRNLSLGRDPGDVGTVIEVRMHPYRECGCLKYGCARCRHARNHYDVMVMCDSGSEWYEAFSWDIVCSDSLPENDTKPGK